VKPPSDRALRAGVATRAVERIGAQPSGRGTLDEVAVEEPLEIRVDGETVAVTMRTPGHDAELALGFLYAEGLIGSVADVGTVAHCGRPGEEGYGNVLDVRAAAGVVIDIERVLDSRRFSTTTSACGVCGRRSIADLVERCRPLSTTCELGSQALGAAVSTLAEQQPNFGRTGGIHAAGIFGAARELLACHEDVGRHNAVDKAVGELLLAGKIGAPPEAGGPALLVVSGRASFEIVQKAAAARIQVVASVSAPSSLAIDLADAAGITLAGFVRGGSFNLYTHASRMTRSAD
jgi:FdhD protein